MCPDAPARMSAVAPEVRKPPNGAQPPNDDPFHVLIQRPLSVPRTNTFVLDGDSATAEGSAVTMPPPGPQPLNEEPLQLLCQMPRSVPTTKTSSVLAPPDATPGPPMRIPPPLTGLKSDGPDGGGGVGEGDG